MNHYNNADSTIDNCLWFLNDIVLYFDNMTMLTNEEYYYLNKARSMIKEIKKDRTKAVDCSK